MWVILTPPYIEKAVCPDATKRHRVIVVEKSAPRRRFYRKSGFHEDYDARDVIF